jgi:DNA-binding CsgD family transcriptional regulator
VRRLGLYNEFFRPLGVEHQVAFTLHHSPDVIVALSLNRTRRDFSERDRALLGSLRPHLLRAYRNAELLTGLRRELALVVDRAEATGISVVRLAPNGRLQDASPGAVDRLADYFEHSALSGRRLPDAVRRWIRHQTGQGDPDENPRPRAPMIVEKDGRHLILTLAGSTDRPLLLIQERRPPVDGRSLRRLGLTTREADVLAWVAQGKTDSETGAILGISPRTVAKHLEHIFQKLGVETRTAAAARAHERGVAT